MQYILIMTHDTGNMYIEMIHYTWIIKSNILVMDHEARLFCLFLFLLAVLFLLGVVSGFCLPGEVRVVSTGILWTTPPVENMMRTTYW